MNRPLTIATFLIATCAIPTGAWSQKVYKCGSSYSQIPCADSVTVDTADARSKAQKAEADKQTARDAKVADTMEKTRLKEEAQALAQNRPAKPSAHKTADKNKEKSAKAKFDTDEDDKKKPKGKKKEPEFFTAKTAAEKKAADTSK